MTSHQIAIPQSELDDLSDRIRRTRLPRVPDGHVGNGFPIRTVRELLHAWETFDWRTVEARLNRFEHHLITVDEVPIHVMRAHGGDHVPVVLIHGWADSIVGMTSLVEPLTAAGHDVIIPSPPGYPLSGQPSVEMSAESSAAAIASAIAALGVERNAVHGGDWGSALAEQLALNFSDRVVGIHLTDPGYHHMFAVEPEEAADDAERAFLAGRDSFDEGSGYIAVQSTQPLTLAYGLADSPVGLLAWLAEKRWAWTDRAPKTEDVLALATLTWCTNSIYSSMRLYAEGMGDWSEDDGSGWEQDGAAEWTSGDGGDGGGWESPVCSVPAAFAIMPRDIMQPPRVFCERFFSDIRRFTLMPAGGHYAAADEPQALAAEIVAFLADL